MSLELLSYIAKNSANKKLVYYSEIAGTFKNDLPYIQLSELLDKQYIFSLVNNGKTGYAVTKLGTEHLHKQLTVTKPKPTIFSKLLHILRIQN